MNLVFLDHNTIGKDIDIALFHRFGALTAYPFTAAEDVPERINGMDVVITNKCRLDAATLINSTAKLICLTATGYDNVDIEFCEKQGIAVCNIRGYATESVVQHTFALLFTLMEHMASYHDYTKTRRFVMDTSFRHLSEWRFHEIFGKKFGIVGMGAIGKRVADIAAAFGCQVFYWSSTDQPRCEAYQRLDLDRLLETCDIVSIHSPLTARTRHLFGIEQFRRMKSEAILINVGRGDILIEEDLAVAIETGLIGGAAIDVISKEPMQEGNPLIRVLEDPRLLVTPHIAWAAIEARERCMDEIRINIESFLEGGRRNRVDTIPPA